MAYPSTELPGQRVTVKWYLVLLWPRVNLRTHFSIAIALDSSNTSESARPSVWNLEMPVWCTLLSIVFQTGSVSTCVHQGGIRVWINRRLNSWTELLHRSQHAAENSCRQGFFSFSRKFDLLERHPKLRLKLYLPRIWIVDSVREGERQIDRQTERQKDRERYAD